MTDLQAEELFRILKTGVLMLGAIGGVIVMAVFHWWER